MTFQRSPLPLSEETRQLVATVHVLDADLQRAIQQITDLEKALGAVTAERDALRAATREPNGHVPADLVPDAMA